jgi:ATP-binding protein involved in chromosome partitioning
VLSPTSAQEKVAQIVHPEFQRSLGELEMVRSVAPQGDGWKVEIDWLTHASPVRDQLAQALAAALPGPLEIANVTQQRSTQPALGGGVLQSVKNVVAIASGKGGVGKSTVAVNVAASLALEGARVGLLDADIYGPSIPALSGIEQSSVTVRDKRLQPVERFGLKIMSMGLLMKPGESVIWRGPMLHGVIQQFCKDVDWGELDFLIVDLPPGTGDVSLSLSQLVPLGGALVVSTPQHVAVGVASKAVSMFKKLNVPLLGLVENMSYYVCPNCAKEDDIFGRGGARAAAAELGLPFLGEVPLNSALRQAGDQGTPVVVSHPDSAPAKVLRRTSQLLAGRLSVAAVAGYEALYENQLSL